MRIYFGLYAYRTRTQTKGFSVLPPRPICFVCRREENNTY